jgi:hypothetical protein
LDPQFLAGLLRATDVVTPLAINPTTHQGKTKSLKRLKSALLGWTANKINAMDGKSALHMAAWKGSLENVEYLLDVIGGCDINAYSQGEFTIGKTALFFAPTQSQKKVLQALLQHIYCQ